MQTTCLSAVDVLVKEFLQDALTLKGLFINDKKPDLKVLLFYFIRDQKMLNLINSSDYCIAGLYW